MIKICFPPGTYGTYLARCVYHYSNLGADQYHSFAFDQHGSSHEFGPNSHIQFDHVHNGVTFGSDDRTVTVLPCESQRLDYFNNAFMKHYQGSLIENLRDTFGHSGISEIDHKLRESWNHPEGFTAATPPWIMREFCSMWLLGFLSDCFDLETYQQVPSVAYIAVNDILHDHQNALLTVFDVLDLQLQVSHSEIEHNHRAFLLSQKYMGSQMRCDQWCDDVLNAAHSVTPCQTMFDEVYVQQRLRTLGFEIRCDGLDVFPRTSTELKEILYRS